MLGSQLLGFWPRRLGSLINPLRKGGDFLRLQAGFALGHLAFGDELNQSTLLGIAGHNGRTFLAALDQITGQPGVQLAFGNPLFAVALEAVGLHYWAHILLKRQPRRRACLGTDKPCAQGQGKKTKLKKRGHRGEHTVSNPSPFQVANELAQTRRDS